MLHPRVTNPCACRAVESRWPYPFSGAVRGRLALLLALLAACIASPLPLSAQADPADAALKAADLPNGFTVQKEDHATADGSPTYSVVFSRDLASLLSGAGGSSGLLLVSNSVSIPRISSDNLHSTGQQILSGLQQGGLQGTVAETSGPAIGDETVWSRGQASSAGIPVDLWIVAFAEGNSSSVVVTMESSLLGASSQDDAARLATIVDSRLSAPGLLTQVSAVPIFGT